jgi:hypothetical protein
MRQTAWLIRQSSAQLIREPKVKLDENSAGCIAGHGAVKFVQWAIFYVQR